MRAPNAEQRAERWTWLIPCLALVLSACAMLMDPMVLRGLRNSTFDQYQRWHPRAADSLPVRIVDIDDESLRRIGQWPWPRDRVAQLLAEIDRLQPSATAVDILFAERDGSSSSRTSRTATTDADLARTLSHGNTAIGFAMSRVASAPTAGQELDDKLHMKATFFAMGGDPLPFITWFPSSVANLPELQQAASGQGAMTFIPDSDGIVRQVPLLMNLDGRLVPSLAAEALRLAARATTYTVRSAGNTGGVINVRIGDRTIETDASGSIWVHYSLPDPAKYLPAWKLIERQVSKEDIAGRIVLVGTSAQGMMDLRFSPLGGIMAGVEAHAQALEQVLTGRQLSRPGWARAVEIIAMLIGAALVGFVAMTRGAAVSSAGFVAIACALGSGAWLAFTRGQVLIDAATPVLGLAVVFIPTTLLRHFLSERRQRWMKQTFSRYVSPNLVDYLVTHPEALELGGKRQRCSFVFADLAGFTGLMEKMDPTTAVSVLNGYLDRMIAIAFENEGTLDRIVGDAVAIVFSAPIEQTDHEQRALRCALQMHAFARGYVDKLAEQGIEFCETRIGVHTGEVTVGNFGGDAIFDYRALGDAVNVASRLEGANKHLGTLICVSEATLVRCPGAPSRPIARLRLAGRESYLMVYEPLSGEASATAADPEYQQAFDLLGQDGDAALTAFEEMATTRPNDPLVRLHLARLQSGKTGDAIELSEK